MAGRKPKPTALKRLAGNPGKRKLNPEEPQARIVRPRVPYGQLSKDGQRAWHKLVPMLADLGVLTETDELALEMMCTHFELAMQAKRQVQKEGLTTCGSTGSLVVHPAQRVWASEARAFRMWAEQFGLTPSARSRVQAVTPEEPDELEQLLFGRRTRIGDAGG
jgi:P27 family predicted phage terminase small subunit